MTRLLGHGDHLVFARRPSPEHGQTLAGEGKNGGVVGQVSAIIERAYGHQMAVFKDEPLPRSEDPVTGRLNAEISARFIAWRFYSEHYANNVNIAASGSHINHAEFCRLALLGENESKRNNLTFVEGPVGGGKTALINFLITKYGYHWWKEESRWFVRYNVQTQASKPDLDATDILVGIAGKLLKILSHPEFKQTPAVGYAKREMREALDGPKEPRLFEELFANLVSTVSMANHRKPIVIIDNIDFAVHRFDEGLFSDQSREKLNRFVRALTEFVNKLWPGAGNPICSMGANILFAVRPETSNLIRSQRSAQQDPNSSSSHLHVFSLVPARWEVVLESRRKLVRDVIDAGTSDEARKKASELALPDVSDPTVKSTITRLHQLTNYGNRDLVTHIAGMLSTPAARNWSSLEILHKRFSTHPAVAEMAFILGRRCRFSQEGSNFPNLYFVRAAAAKKSTAAAAYLPSYWLKRLVLEYVRAIEGKLTGGPRDGCPPISPETILDTFSGSSEPHSEIDGYYPTDVVRDCLGELSRADDLNLLWPMRRITRDGELSVEGVNSTPRAEHCFTYLFDKFIYLQLVVDDFDLWVPSSLGGRFAYSKDYRYLLDPDPRQYGQSAAAVIAHKAEQVYLFLGCLELAFKIEQQRYYKAFAGLAALGTILPSMASIRAGLLDELKAIRPSFSQTDALPTEQQLLAIWKGVEDGVTADLEAAMQWSLK